ncbi:hypothetical protein [Cecembia rubra]
MIKTFRVLPEGFLFFTSSIIAFTFT